MKQNAICFRPNENLLDELNEEAQTRGMTKTAVIEEVLSQGLKLRMQTGTPSIHPHFLEHLSPAGVFHFYQCYLQALGAERTEVLSDYHFARIPNEGTWKALGLGDRLALINNDTRLVPEGYFRQASKIVELMR